MKEVFSIDKLDELVLYITTPPYHNITQAAEHFNTSRATINKALKELSDPTSLYYNEWKSKRVKAVLEELLKVSRSRAGSKSKRKIIINHELALSLRYANVYGGSTLRDLAKLVGCSHMTVCNAINALSSEDLLAQDTEYVHDRDELRQKQMEALATWLEENTKLSKNEAKTLEEQWLKR